MENFFNSKRLTAYTIIKCLIFSLCFIGNVQFNFAQILNYWNTGSSMISCAPSNFKPSIESFNDGYVVGIIDIRESCDFDKLINWPPSGKTYASKMYHQTGNDWKFSNLGTVFPIAVDENGNIFVGATTVFGSIQFPGGKFPNGHRGSGSIYKIDGRTGNCDTNFVETRQETSFNPVFPNHMPNQTPVAGNWGYLNQFSIKSGPGLGDLAYNRIHKYLYASNFEDGKIYKINPLNGNIESTYDPRFGDNTINGLDNNSIGFCPKGQRPWGLGVKQEGTKVKLYYALWKTDSRDTFPENLNYNEIWSVELNNIGNPIPASEKKEITLPHLNLPNANPRFIHSSNPVSDIAFTSTGEMYLAERGMDSDIGRTLLWDTITGNLLPNQYNPSNHARIIRYFQSGSTWLPFNVSDKFYELGRDSSTHKSTNSAGGLAIGDYKCGVSNIPDQYVWASGDFDDILPNVYIYGVTGMETNTGDAENHFYIDFDNSIYKLGAETTPKSEVGDIEILGVWEGFNPLPTLACDDHVNVSLDSTCCAVITPAMVLEGNYPLNCLKVVLKDKYGNVIPTSPKICGQYINQTITFELIDTCTKNKCWGTLIVEDKLGPKIECQNPDTVFCNNTGYNWTIPPGVDNCGGVVKTIVLSDETTKLPCDSFCIARRLITYYYQDQYGNHSDTCVKEICFKKIEFKDIVWPKDTAYSCEVWDTIPPPSVSGVPTAGGYPLYPDWFLCKMAVTYEDQLIPICPKTFKVLRTWTVLDWCKRSPENVYKHYQIVKVLDEKGPQLDCPEDVTVSTDVWSCTGTVIMAPPLVSWECSDSVYVTVEYKITGKNGQLTYEGTNKNNIKKLPNGYFSITGLSMGLNLVTFYVTDQCGNTSTCTTEVTVEDHIPPVAVCDQKTTVALTIDGTAKIEAYTFDDGSHDNCGIDYFEVKRMDNGYPCDSIRGKEWGPYAFFCCEDIGKTIMVAMRVWDRAGNSNTCMVEVEVQDKIPPVIFCPPHITISCEYDYPDLNVFGTVVSDISKQKAIVIKDPKVKFSSQAIDGYAYDGCGVTVVELPPVYALPCGKGTITRTWEATDPRGLKTRCSQIITVIDYNPDNVTVVWPRDTFSTSICTSKPDFDADHLGKPKVYGADKCNTIMINYTDQIFTLEPDACIKVLRKWTVIDWCIYQPNNPQTKGYWSWIQVIKVNNFIAPNFTTSCKDRTIAVFGPGCGGQVDIKAQATDDCTDSADLVWYHEVDLYNDGKSPGIEYLHSGPGADASNYYPIGTHKITFRVKDACGNESWCVFLVKVVDGKLPTPYCLGNIVTTIMPTAKSISIWAKDFNLNSEDNCTPKDSLKYFFLVNNVLVPSLTLDCSNIGINKLRVYVRDEAGNLDYCEVSLDLQDPNHVCGTSNLGVSGKITTTDQHTMKDVTIIMERNNPTGINQSYTDAQGSYIFSNLTKGADYQIKASYNQNHINGVSTQDIVMIQKHILGIQLFDNVYKYIAADANNSNTITAADIAEIRKLILGITNQFSKNESWRFVPKQTVFNDPNNPWPYTEQIKHQELLTPKQNDDFYAVKIGDLSGNATPTGFQGSTSRSNESYTIAITDQSFTKGQSLRVPVYATEQMLVSGMQIELEANANVAIHGIEAGEFKIEEDHYRIQDNHIRISFANVQDQMIKSGDVLFTILVHANQNGTLSQTIKIASAVMHSEIYNEQVKPATLKLKVKDPGLEEKDLDIVISQNVPNPFLDYTTINFQITKDQTIVFDLFDTQGKRIFRKDYIYPKGSNNFILDRSDVKINGVYFLNIQSSTISKTMKIIFNN